MLHEVDPELRPSIESFIATMVELNLSDLPALRAMLSQTGAAERAELPPFETVITEDRRVPGFQAGTDVTVRVYQPVERPAILPALLWIHGGGYVLGDIEGDDLYVKQLAQAVQCVAVSVDYRLAPEHPFPAPLEDCYAALVWLAEHTDELGVNPKRIAIGGASAGGGLAAALALLARDRAEVSVAFQLLIYPMIDDCNVVQACDTIPDTLLWTRRNNLIGWRCYLGCEPGGPQVSVYAAPTRATDLAGLPPAYIPVGSLDLFLRENVDYAMRLSSAGVPTELHVYPGGYHGFDVFGPEADISKRFAEDRDRVLKRVLHGQ